MPTQTAQKWNREKLGKISDVTSSKRIYASDYVVQGIPFYRSKEVIEKNKGNSISTELYISNEKFESIKEKFGVPKAGDMLITSVGTLGVPYLVKEDEVFYFKDGNLIWFRDFDAKKVLPKFVYYSATSDDFQKRIKGIAIGSSQSAFTISAIKEFEIDIPDIPTQKKIADILSTYDDLIENNNRRIKILEETAQKIYTEWFGNFRFPGHEKSKMVDSGTEFGMIPEGWEMKKLGEISSLITKGTTPTTLNKNFVKEGLNFIKIEAIEKNGQILVDKLAKIDAETHDLLGRSKLQKNDILFSIAGAIGRTVLISEKILPANTNQALAIIRIKDSAFIHYAYQVISSSDFLIFATERIVQTAQANVSLSVISSAKILIPKNEIVESYNEFIIPLFLVIEKISSENQNLKKTRDLLIPQLVSGKLEIK